MGWTLTHDLDEYVAAAGHFLCSRPVRHTVQLAAVETLRSAGMSAFGDTIPLFGWWRSSGGAVTAAVFHGPPYPVLLTRLPGNAAAPLAGALVAHRWHVAAVTAGERDAAAFAAAWQPLTGAKTRELDRSRLFRLGRLDLPAPFPRGSARLATTGDRDLVVSWLAASAAEAGSPSGKLTARRSRWPASGGRPREWCASARSTPRRTSGGRGMRGALISFVFKPAGGFGVSVGWGIGAFIGVIAAVAPLGVPLLRSRTGR